MKVTCEFGKARCKCIKKMCFGGCNCGCEKCNLKPSFGFGASLNSFYPQGAQKNTFLTPKVKECLNIVYGPEDSNYTSTGYVPDIQNSLGFGRKNKEFKYLHSLK